MKQSTQNTTTLTMAVRRLRRRLTRPHVILGIVLAAIMLYLVIAPLGVMFQTTFTWQPQDVRLTPDAEPGKLTLFHYLRVFSSDLSNSMLWTPLKNTLITAVATSVLALAIGILLAWLVVRTDLPGRRWISSLLTIPYMLPSWTIALAWIVVFKNERMGGAIGFLQSATGLIVPDWLSYGPVPIILCQAIHYYSFAFLLVSGALTTFDARLEESGEVLGARRWQVLTQITVPLILPSILSAFIMTFSRTLGSFGTPAFLGNPIRYYVLSTTLYSNIQSRLQADGYVLSMVLIAISILTIYINQRALGVRKSFVTIAGKGFTSTPIRLGRLKGPILVVMWFFILVAVFAPLLFLVYQTFMLHPNNYSLSNFTLHFWTGKSNMMIADGIEGIFRNPELWNATRNSVLLAVSTAGIAAVLGILLGYAVVRGRGTLLSKLVEQMAFLPYLIPSIAFGAIYLGMFAKPLGPIPSLYGTFWLLLLVSVVKHLPYSSRSGTAAMMQVGGELEEAALVAGSSWAGRFRQIILPLCSSGLVSGFLLTFITTMRELSLIILLVTPITRTLPTLTFRYAEQGYHQPGDAITVVLVVIILFAEWLVRRIPGAEIGKGLGA